MSAVEHDAGSEGPVARSEPPRRQVGIWAWLRANLFSGHTAPAIAGNVLLTLAFGALLGWLAFRGLRFVFVTTDWEIIRRNLERFMVGLFPSDELWRIWTSLYLAALGIGFVVGAAPRTALRGVEERGVEDEERSPLVGLVRRAWPLALLVVAVLSQTRTIGPTLLVLAAFAVATIGWVVGRRVPRWLAGRWPLVLVVAILASLLLPTLFAGVPQSRWGGLHLTLYVTVIGIAASFPLGILVALVRRSRLPALRVVGTAYIEAFRGVPLITLLFMGEFVLLFFFPTGVSAPDRLVRAIIVIIIFESAYIAEAVRGGLNAVPNGQYEAARALGLSPYRVMRRVVMPQALRAVIPAIVSEFISVYKNTTLLFIIGFTELLTVAEQSRTQPDFLAQRQEGVTFFFVALLFWTGSYMMSRESQRIERRLGVGER